MADTESEKIRHERHWDFYFIAERAIKRAEAARDEYEAVQKQWKASRDDDEFNKVLHHLTEGWHATVTAQIMTGVAAEAYITQYIFDRFEGKDRVILEKMSMPGKWRFAPSLAMKVDGFKFGGRVLQGLDAVKTVRDDLVHYKPKMMDPSTMMDLDQQIADTKTLVNHLIFAIQELHKIDPSFGDAFITYFLTAL